MSDKSFLALLIANLCYEGLHIFLARSNNLMAFDMYVHRT